MTLHLNECAFRANAGGTVDFVVSAALTGFYTPAQCASPTVTNGGTYFYRAESDDLSQYESGIGTYNTSTSTLARTTVRQSSNSGSKVNFSAAPKVRITTLAEILNPATLTTVGPVELATDAETQTGTDNERAITPANLTAKEASATQWRNNTADRILTTDIAWSAAAEVTLTDAATVALDLNSGLNFVVTLAGNRAMGNPTNEKVGQSGVIRIVQDATGSRTLSYGTDWEFAGGSAPTLSTAANAQDLLFYHVIAADRVFAHLVKAIS